MLATVLMQILASTIIYLFISWFSFSNPGLHIQMTALAAPCALILKKEKPKNRGLLYFLLKGATYGIQSNTLPVSDTLLAQFGGYRNAPNPQYGVPRSFILHTKQNGICMNPPVAVLHAQSIGCGVRREEELQGRWIGRTTAGLSPRAPGKTKY